MRDSRLSLRWRQFVLLMSILALAACPVSLLAAELAKPAQTPVLEHVAPPKDLAELRGIEDRIKKVVAKVLPATVGIIMRTGQGSGVIVSKDGLVMTAGHVVSKPGQTVTFHFADGKTAKGITLGLYHCADAGLMKITDKGEWPFVEKGHSTDVKLGAWCVAVGHPLGVQPGRPPVVRIGRVLRTELTVVQTDCPIVAGDSGGPVFDLEGRVIAINSRIGGSMEQNLHVPVDIFNQNWERMVKGEVFHTDLPSRDEDTIKAALRPALVEAARCVARVKCDGKDVALGTIVGPDGWILTKASELRGKAVCQLPDKREIEARIVGVNPAFDLAMLKIEATGLPAIAWASKDPAVGQWVATVGMTDSPLGVGIISVPRRAIPPISGQMGVMLTDDETAGGARIESLIPQSPADRAGLKPKDVITGVDGKPVKSRIEAVAIVRHHRPGETVKLTIRRGKETHDYSITLLKLDTPATRIRDMQNGSGVGISKRADAFPAVLQHDTVLKPVDCGGPLVDLNGKVVGINIAHGGRTEAYCLPADVLLPLMYDLMSGRLTPQDKAGAPAERQAGKKPAEARPDEKKRDSKRPEQKKPGSGKRANHEK